MSIDLTATNAAKIAGALLHERRKAGSPAMGMVLTFIVITDEGDHYDALRAARTVSREHPARVLGVIRRSSRGAANLDAEIKIGEGGSGETVLLRMSGELAKHPESVVLPLLLPDSPVVAWWPGKPPEDPSTDPIGALAQRRITDAATVERGRSRAMLTQATNYAPGNTDLSWTRLTSWRALLAAALDQYPAKITGGEVEAERVNVSADLLVAWLTRRLKVDVSRAVTKGPGITSVSLRTGGGDIVISRPDGVLADFAIPNAPTRPVALKRRETPELLAEELRRLDPDDIYEETVKSLCRLAERTASGTSTKKDASAKAALSAKSTAKKRAAPAKSAAKKTATKSATNKPTAKKTAHKLAATPGSAGS
ncbi:MAG: glucose-6-phosphate dehydrogenase assembly protein OpcA [Nocardioidaceae bacterium]|nr:glucose-6-phosphate dehydrogenase assembly protein OpcA [Nocardioidaceae bacterium]